MKQGDNMKQDYLSKNPDDFICDETMSDKHISQLADFYISDEELITMTGKNTRQGDFLNDTTKTKY